MESDKSLDDLVLHTLRFLAEDDPQANAHPEVTAALQDPETFTRLLDRLSALEAAAATRTTRGPRGPAWEDWLAGNAVTWPGPITRQLFRSDGFHLPHDQLQGPGTGQGPRGALGRGPEEVVRSRWQGSGAVRELAADRGTACSGRCRA